MSYENLTEYCAAVDAIGACHSRSCLRCLGTEVKRLKNHIDWYKREMDSIAKIETYAAMVEERIPETYTEAIKELSSLCGPLYRKLRVVERALNRKIETVSFFKNHFGDIEDDYRDYEY